MQKTTWRVTTLVGTSLPSTFKGGTVIPHCGDSSSAMTTTSFLSVGSRLSTAVVLLLLAVWPAAPAAAYKLRTTEAGLVLIWKSSHIVLEVSTRGLKDLPDAPAAVDAAFEAWTNAGAPLSIESRPTIAELPSVNDSRNTVSWVRRDDWPYSSDVVGMTVSWYKASSGQISETDIMLNLDDHQWSTGAPSEGHFDIQDVLAHETGHFFGLAHEPTIPTATMFPYTPTGETSKRTLESDDLNGLAAIVTETKRRLSSATSADNAATGPALPADRVGGCSVAKTEGNGTLIAGLLICLALAAGRRWRKIVTLAVGLLLTAPSTGEASMVVGMSIEQMTWTADVIARGTVVRRAAVMDQGLIYTDVKLRCHRCYKGACRDQAELLLRVPGGEIGDLGMAVEGAPRLQLGETVMIFGVQRGRRLALVGLSLGLFRLTAQTAHRDLAGIVFADHAMRAPVTKLRLVDLERILTHTLSARPSRPR